MTLTIFRNARLFDGASETLAEGMEVAVDGDLIKEVSTTPITSGEADIVDCGARVLMPGMIDAHVHVYISGLSPASLARPLTYHAQYATGFLRHILACGFTTVRDVGGADVGLANALADGLLEGPRLFFGGHVISQTGGHGDSRHADEEIECCGCRFAQMDFLSIVADGPDAVRWAVREELRRGASHIKIMGSGGVMSPNDPVDRCQFSEAEIAVAVEETTRWGAYVAAHCHPNEGVKRLARLGVRSIEHGTLIDAEGARIAVEHGAFIVPTMATIFALLDNGPRLGMAPVSFAKLEAVAGRALEGLTIMHEAGVRMGFGTDLLGPLHGYQGTEFTLRAKVLPPIEILRSACQVNAALIGQEGKLGCIAPGAYADLLVVDGDPLADISLLARPAGAGLAAIMKAGAFLKRTI
jgi:imidazolonepropionase-like amidohydrolase